MLPSKRPKWDVWDVLSPFLLKIYVADYNGLAKPSQINSDSFFQKLFNYRTVSKNYNLSLCRLMPHLTPARLMRMQTACGGADNLVLSAFLGHRPLCLQKTTDQQH